MKDWPSGLRRSSLKHHEYAGYEFESHSLFFFLPTFPQFHDFHEMKKVSIILLCIFDAFYAPLFIHNTCTLSFYKKNMANTSAESYVSLKGNDKAI